MLCNNANEEIPNHRELDSRIRKLDALGSVKALLSFVKDGY